MPLLKINTNKEVAPATQKEFLKEASYRVGKILQKPEKVVMTIFEPPVPMTFAGTEEATAYLEVKSIGLTEEQASCMAGDIPELVKKHLSISPDRIYIEFSDAPGKFWGWNMGTF
ncbi:MAG: phenylpyruvate tautomerase MIF-related protein [Bacteroidota bacterium]